MSHLSIQDFRGATQPLDLTFEAHKSVILIFGENGTGKSTIVDALESVIEGSTAFLDNWKLGKGKRKESFIPSLGKSLGDVKVSLKFGSRTYSASLNAKGLQLCNTPDRPHAKVLRRKSLQAFIDAEPAQRYKEVAAFLDIPQIEAAEASLREALKEAEKRYSSAIAACSHAEESLQGLWEAEGSPGLDKKQDAKTWARSEAAIPLETLQGKLTSLQTAVKHTEKLQNQTKAVEEAREQLVSAELALADASTALAVLESDPTKSNSQLVTLLEDAQTYLTGTPDTLCPVCEQTQIDSAQLVERLKVRIQDMQKLKQANDSKIGAQARVQSCRDQLSKENEKMLVVAEAVQQHFSSEVNDENSIQLLKSNDQERTAAAVTALQLEMASRQQEIQSQRDTVQKQINNQTSIKHHTDTLREKLAEAKLKEALCKRLGQAVTVVESKRKQHVEKVLKSIANDVDSLYQLIHPEEAIGNLTLKLDEQQRGSLAYGVAFGGQQDIQPQPYYSESHLDTLGLCIFLALAKRNNADRTLVVLDDVLGSVDQQHLQKTISMLFGQAPHFSQLLLTSHYRPLRDQIRFARHPSTSVQLIELKPWNFGHGIKSAKNITYVQELREKLKSENFNRDDVASQAGKLFESLLEFISITYKCSVPHLIEPRFTFGQLACAPKKSLKQALRTVALQQDGDIPTPLGPIYEKLEQAISVRNLVGAHFNQWAGELSDQDVRDMAELALELADALICQHCGSLPTSIKSGSYWECSCKKTQMHPLQQPG